MRAPAAGRRPRAEAQWRSRQDPAPLLPSSSFDRSGLTRSDFLSCGCLRWRGSNARLVVVLLIAPTPEDPAPERTEPPENVVHVAQIHQLDEVAVKVFAEEEGVPSRRSLRCAEALDSARRQ